MDSTQKILELSIQSRELNKKVAEVLRPQNLTSMQWVIVNLIARNPGCKVTQIAKEIDSSIAFVTVALNMLEGKGYIDKKGSEADARAKTVHYTGSSEFLEETEKAIQEALSDTDFVLAGDLACGW